MYSKFFRQTPKAGAGFTLIELLVVIAIIGILTSIVMVSLGSVRAKGRDVKRLSDLKEMSKLFALNYEPGIQFGGYGIQGTGGIFVPASNFSSYVTQLGSYKDISGVTTACTNASTGSCNYSIGDKAVLGGSLSPSTQNYIVCARLETNLGPLEGQVGGPGGPVSISSKTNGAVVAGCVF